MQSNVVLLERRRSLMARDEQLEKSDDEPLEPDRDAKRRKKRPLSEGAAETRVAKRHRAPHNALVRMPNDCLMTTLAFLSGHSGTERSPGAATRLADSTRDLFAMAIAAKKLARAAGTFAAPKASPRHLALSRRRRAAAWRFLECATVASEDAPPPGIKNYHGHSVSFRHRSLKPFECRTLVIGGPVGRGGVDVATFAMSDFANTYATVGLVAVDDAPEPAPYPSLASPRRLAAALPGVGWNSFSGHWIAREKGRDSIERYLDPATRRPLRTDWPDTQVGAAVLRLRLEGGSLRYACWSPMCSRALAIKGHDLSSDDVDYEPRALDVSDFLAARHVAFAVTLYTNCRADVHVWSHGANDADGPPPPLGAPVPPTRWTG